MQSGQSPFVVNIVPLANVITNTSGVNQVSQLSGTVASIQEMVNTTTRTINTNFLGSYTSGTSVQVTSPINLVNVGITSNGFPYTTGGGSTSNFVSLVAQSINTSTINVSDICYAKEYVTLSDKNVKGGLSTIDSFSFESLNKIHTYKFNYLDSEESKIGILAQELEEVYPECVTTSSGIKYVNYPSLVSVLLRAVRKLDERVKLLENVRMSLAVSDE